MELVANIFQSFMWRIFASVYSSRTVFGWCWVLLIIPI